MRETRLKEAHKKIGEEIDKIIVHHEEKGPHDDVAIELKRNCWGDIAVRQRVRALEKAAGHDRHDLPATCTP